VKKTKTRPYRWGDVPKTQLPENWEQSGRRTVENLVPTWGQSGVLGVGGIYLESTAKGRKKKLLMTRHKKQMDAWQAQNLEKGTYPWKELKIGTRSNTTSATSNNGKDSSITEQSENTNGKSTRKRRKKALAIIVERSKFSLG